MSKNQESFIISPNIMIIKQHKILLLRRDREASIFPTYWHCPTGKIELGESPRQAIIRETFEEVGLRVSPRFGTIVAVKVHDFQQPGLIYKDINFFFVVDNFADEPVNKEPKLHSDMSWFDLDKLPEIIIPAVKFGIQQYMRGEFYGELGY